MYQLIHACELAEITLFCKMVRTRRGLGKAAYEYWQKHGFDAKLRAELNWEADEYRKYEEQHKKHLVALALTLVVNSQGKNF